MYVCVFGKEGRACHDRRSPQPAQYQFGQRAGHEVHKRKGSAHRSKSGSNVPPAPECASGGYAVIQSNGGAPLEHNSSPSPLPLLNIRCSAHAARTDLIARFVTLTTDGVFDLKTSMVSFSSGVSSGAACTSGGSGCSTTANDTAAAARRLLREGFSSSVRAAWAMQSRRGLWPPPANRRSLWGRWWGNREEVATCQGLN